MQAHSLLKHCNAIWSKPRSILMNYINTCWLENSQVVSSHHAWLPWVTTKPPSTSPSFLNKVLDVHKYILLTLNNQIPFLNQHQLETTMRPLKTGTPANVSHLNQFLLLSLWALFSDHHKMEFHTCPDFNTEDEFLVCIHLTLYINVMKKKRFLSPWLKKKNNSTINLINRKSKYVQSVMNQVYLCTQDACPSIWRAMKLPSCRKGKRPIQESVFSVMEDTSQILLSHQVWTDVLLVAILTLSTVQRPEQWNCHVTWLRLKCQLGNALSMTSEMMMKLKIQKVMKMLHWQGLNT